MDIKDKYESIDQSKLSPEINHVLKAMKRKSKNFSVTKYNNIFEPQLDKMIAGLKRKYPESIKGYSAKKDDTTSKSEIEKALEGFNKIIEENPSLRGLRNTNIQRDSTRKALPKGKRISESGKAYYENRENRSDRLAPNYPKNAPLLEKGGLVKSSTHKLRK